MWLALYHRFLSLHVFPHTAKDVAQLCRKKYCKYLELHQVVSRGAVPSAASSYAAMRMVAGSRPVLVIA